MPSGLRRDAWKDQHGNIYSDDGERIGYWRLPGETRNDRNIVPPAEMRERIANGVKREGKLYV